MADVQGDGAADCGGVGVPAELNHAQQQHPVQGGKAGGQHGGHSSHHHSQNPSRWVLPLPASTYLGMWASLVVGVHQSK